MASPQQPTAHRHHTTGTPVHPGRGLFPVPRPAPVPPAALELLAKARTGLVEARGLESANERYATAHLAALRTAAAVLAARGRPELNPRRRARIRSAWELLPELAPELTDWSAFFASGAPRRARAEAGIPNAATPRAADDLLRAAATFHNLSAHLLRSQPRLPAQGGGEGIRDAG